MNRRWGIVASILGALGTGSAAVMATAAEHVDATPTIVASAPSTPTPSAADTVITRYQIGDAAEITLSVTDGSTVISSAVANAGWTVASMSSPGPTVKVVLSDSSSEVTFTAVITASGAAAVSVSTSALSEILDETDEDEHQVEGDHDDGADDD